jgi:hypothetical protein
MIITETVLVRNQSTERIGVLNKSKATQYVDVNAQYPDCTLLVESAAVIVGHLTYITSALHLSILPLGLIKTLHFIQAKVIPCQYIDLETRSISLV